MKRIYYPFHELEEAECDMWRITSVAERPLLIKKSISLLSNPEKLKCECESLIEQWPRSISFNLTNESSNRVAWMGQAVCCFSCGVPEECTRAAWGFLSNKDQQVANFIVSAVIENWEINTGNKEQQLCLNMA